MSHALIETVKDAATQVCTCVHSFIYECPTCGTRKRYAAPSGKEVVVCNGSDFGTKIKANDLLLEVSEALFLREAYATNVTITADADNQAAVDSLVVLGLVQNITDTSDYELTASGKETLTEPEN